MMKYTVNSFLSDTFVFFKRETFQFLKVFWSSLFISTLKFCHRISFELSVVIDGIGNNVKAASHGSLMLVTATYSQQMTEVIIYIQQHAACSISLIEDGSCCIFAGENRQLKFHKTPYRNYHFKEQKVFFLCHNDYYCFRKNFKTILHSAERLGQNRVTEK